MLEDLGNLGDFIGGIAVIATLLYLAMQVRQNTRSLRSAALDSNAIHFADRQMAIAQDPDLADLVERGAADYHALQGVEKRRYRAYMLGHLKQIESGFFKHEERLLPHSQWEGQRAGLVYSFGRPGWQQCWQEINPVFSEEFRKFVDEVVASRTKSAPAAFYEGDSVKPSSSGEAGGD